MWQWNLLKGNLESLLNILQHFLISVRADEGDRQTLGTETASTTDTVEVRISITGKVVVDGEVDTLDINTTTEDVGGNTDSLLELFEVLVTTDTVAC